MFEVVDLSARAGSEIRADRASLIHGEYSERIQKLLVDRSALVFRKLFLTDEEQLQFAKTIGKVVPHKWKIGDFLLWDNTGTMHRADTYSPTSNRLMHRTTLHGEEPVF